MHELEPKRWRKRAEGAAVGMVQDMWLGVEEGVSVVRGGVPRGLERKCSACACTRERAERADAMAGRWMGVEWRTTRPIEHTHESIEIRNQGHRFDEYIDHARGRTVKQDIAIDRLRDELGASRIGGLASNFSEIECECNEQGACRLVAARAPQQQQQHGVGEDDADESEQSK